MNTSQHQSAPSGQTNPKTTHDLHQAFASLALGCEKPVMIAQAMRHQGKGGTI